MRDDDGRHARSERSKQALIDALVDLVSSGVAHPTSQQVASAAGRVQRTLYCRFGSMDELYDTAIGTLPEGDPARRLLEMDRRPNRTLERLQTLEAQLATVQTVIESAINGLTAGEDPVAVLAAVQQALAETVGTDGTADPIGA